VLDCATGLWPREQPDRCDREGRERRHGPDGNIVDDGNQAL
jgi:hypothetical protein